MARGARSRARDGPASRPARADCSPTASSRHRRARTRRLRSGSPRSAWLCHRDIVDADGVDQLHQRHPAIDPHPVVIDVEIACHQRIGPPAEGVLEPQDRVRIDALAPAFGGPDDEAGVLVRRAQSRIRRLGELTRRHAAGEHDKRDELHAPGDFTRCATRGVEFSSVDRPRARGESAVQARTGSRW